MNPYVSVILDNLLNVVTMLLVPLLAYGVSKSIAYLEAKLKFNVDLNTEAKIQEVVHNSVLRASAWAHSQTKGGRTRPSGADKLDKAVTYVVSELDRLGYDELAVEKIKEMIEGALAKQKVDNARVFNVDPITFKDPT